MKTTILLITPFLIYAVLFYSVNIFYFFDDNIEIVYFFRFVKRKKNIDYKDIERIRYVHKVGKGLQPMIVIVCNGQGFPIWLKPSNSFTHRFFSKRKEILEFLALKGISIEIQTDFKKDNEILRGYAKIDPPFLL